MVDMFPTLAALAGLPDPRTIAGSQGINGTSLLPALIDPPIFMGNRMTKTPDGENLLVLSQGFESRSGAIWELDRKTLKAKVVVDCYFGRGFNSPNDIQTHQNGMIWLGPPRDSRGSEGDARKLVC